MENQIKKLRREIKINNIFLLVLVGAFLNLSVIVLNDSQMPVFYYSEIPEVPEDYFAFKEFNQVKFPLLSDIFGFDGFIKYSIGDVFIFVGGFLVISLFIKDKIMWRFKSGPS